MNSAGDSSSSADTMNVTASASSSADQATSESHNLIEYKMNSLIFPPGFVQDPSAFLRSIASQSTPSLDGLASLAGSLSSWFRQAEQERALSKNSQSSPTGDQPSSHLAQLYLCAAAKQLHRFQSSKALLQNELEIKNDVLTAVGAAGSLCSDRAGVLSSGILPVLEMLARISDQETNSSKKISLDALSTSKTFPPLTPAHTAFLQCAVVAKEYELAKKAVDGTWPIPTASLQPRAGKKTRQSDEDLHGPLTTILKYYFMRGIIHYACGSDQYSMAHRCWWTCVSLPIDYNYQLFASSIALDAWKKLTLVQPLLEPSYKIATNESDGSSKAETSKSLPHSRLPRCTPKGLLTTIRSYIEDATAEQKTRREKTKDQDEGTLNEEAVDSGGYQPIVYTQLGPAVQAEKRSLAEQLVKDYESILKKDGNLEMAQNCLSRLRELQVRTASQQFAVTSLSVLSRRWAVTTENAAQQLLEAQRSVPVQIEPDGTVLFGNDTIGVSATSSRTTMADLDGWVKLLHQLQHMDVDIATSSKFQSYKQKEGKGAESTSSGGPRGVEDFYGDPSG